MGVVFMSGLLLQKVRVALQLESGSLKGVCEITSVCSLDKACGAGSTGGKDYDKVHSRSNECIRRGVGYHLCGSDGIKS